MYRKDVRALPRSEDDREEPPVVGHLVARISHGARDIDDTIANLIARQCGLPLAGFNRLVSCDMSSEEWDDIIRSQGGRNPYLGRQLT